MLIHFKRGGDIPLVWISGLLLIGCVKCTAEPVKCAGDVTHNLFYIPPPGFFQVGDEE